MKKIIGLILVAALSLACLTGCKKEQPIEESKTTFGNTTVATTSEMPTTSEPFFQSVHIVINELETGETYSYTFTKAEENEGFKCSFSYVYETPEVGNFGRRDDFSEAQFDDIYNQIQTLYQKGTWTTNFDNLDENETAIRYINITFDSFTYYAVSSPELEAYLKTIPVPETFTVTPNATIVD